MRSVYRTFLSLLLTYYLSACSSAYPELGDDTTRYQYQCESGERFAVTYGQSFARAVLHFSANDYRLKRIGSGAGARYILADDPPDTHHPILLFTKDDQSRLEFQGQILKNCQIQ